MKSLGKPKKKIHSNPSKDKNFRFLGSDLIMKWRDERRKRGKNKDFRTVEK